MARTSSIAKQKKRERMVALKWDKRQLLKKTILDLSKSEEERSDAVVALNNLLFV